MNVPAFCVDISCVGYTVYTLEIRVIYWPVWWPCPALRESGKTEEDAKGIDLGRGKKKEKRYVILHLFRPLSSRLPSL